MRTRFLVCRFFFVLASQVLLIASSTHHPTTPPIAVSYGYGASFSSAGHVKPLQDGEHIVEQATIETTHSSAALILFTDGSRIGVRPQSRLTFTRVATNPPFAQISLAQGTLWLQASPKRHAPTTFEIETEHSLITFHSDSGRIETDTSQDIVVCIVCSNAGANNCKQASFFVMDGVRCVALASSRAANAGADGIDTVFFSSGELVNYIASNRLTKADFSPMGSDIPVSGHLQNEVRLITASPAKLRITDSAREVILTVHDLETPSMLEVVKSKPSVQVTQETFEEPYKFRVKALASSGDATIFVIDLLGGALAVPVCIGVSC